AGRPSGGCRASRGSRWWWRYSSASVPPSCCAPAPGAAARRTRTGRTPRVWKWPDRRARSKLTTSAAAEEIAAEQRHVDRVYARLEVIKKEAREVEAAGYRIAKVGNYGALVERDAMVYHAAR